MADPDSRLGHRPAIGLPLSQPGVLPKGSIVHMRYTYDNSSGNAHNPHVPPVRVKAGNRSEDEMGASLAAGLAGEYARERTRSETVASRSVDEELVE